MLVITSSVYLSQVNAFVQNEALNGIVVISVESLQLSRQYDQAKETMISNTQKCSEKTNLNARI